MARSIVVVGGTSNVPKTINTDVKTWGELKPLIGDQWNASLDAVLKSTKATLDRDDAVLTTGDDIIFLVPIQNKAGLATLTETLKDLIEDAIRSNIEDENRYATEDIVREAGKVIDTFFLGTSAATGTGLTALEQQAQNELKDYL